MYWWPIGQQIHQKCNYMTIDISMLDNIFLLLLEGSRVNISFLPSQGRF